MERLGWMVVGLVIAVVLMGQGGGPLSWAQSGQVVDGIAAVVNDEIITIHDVRDAMALESEQLSQQFRGQALQDRMRLLYRQTLTSLTDVQLQLARARQMNLRVTDEDVQGQIEALKKQNQLSDEQLVQMLKTRGLTLEAYRKQIQEGLLIAKVVNAEVRSRLVILDSELQEAYQARQERYKTAGTQTVSHILFLVPPQATPAEEDKLRARAESVLQQLRKGADFTELARKFSDGPSAERNGLLGTFQPGELLPGFEEAAAALKPGEISQVVRTSVGFHIIRVDERHSGKARSFDEVQEDLRTELLRGKTERKYQEWMESLRQQAYIKILYEG